MKSIITLLLLLSLNVQAQQFNGYEEELQECKEEVITQHGDNLDKYELESELEECQHDIDYIGN